VWFLLQVGYYLVGVKCQNFVFQCFLMMLMEVALVLHVDIQFFTK
jgi:hypothetical protein